MTHISKSQTISIWTILICSFGGSIGAIIVIILSYLKIAFVG